MYSLFYHFCEKIVGDEKKRQQYDQHGFVDENPFSGGGGGHGRDASSIFEEFMRQYAQGNGGFDIFGNQQREQVLCEHYYCLTYCHTFSNRIIMIITV
jgi:DnaJ-class molecular chaperone